MLYLILYHIKDFDRVSEIFDQMFELPITRELLETTRLARYVNQVRRSLTNEVLARRAKNLLRKWREAVLPNPANQQQQQVMVNFFEEYITNERILEM